MMDYVNLHTHTHFSIFDGIATTEEYAERAKENGMNALSITDHGTLSGHRDFTRTMRNHGIKPILGVEAYYCPDRHDKRDNKDREDVLDQNYNHLIIIAKNDNGLENLSRLNEIGWTEGFYKKPRIDKEVLFQYGDDLIITSGCMGGMLNQAIENDRYADAKAHVQEFKDRFGENYFIEVMPHNVEGMNAKLLELADSMGVPAVVTADCHHATTDQKEIQELVLLLQTHAKIEKESTFKGASKIDDMMDRLDYLYGADRRMSFNKFDIHLMSGDEMWDAMASEGIERPDIFENTVKIADQIEEYSFQENLDLLPVSYREPDSQLERLALSGLKSKGIESEEYLDRIQEELTVINDKGFAPYFLVVKNMISWAKKQGILVGPGRGSSAGSLVCYALGITDIDPIKHGLLFFRFLDPSRSDWPDIDTDIQDSRREEVKDYLVRQYRHVASIATYTVFKDKGVVRDVARILNVPLDDVNKVLKVLDTWEEFEFGKQAAEFRRKYPEVVTYGRLLRGRIRSTGIHAAGVVTSKEPIAKIAPMETRNIPGKKVRMPVVALDMTEVENLGLIKIDALGLKTLSVISDTLKAIEKRTGTLVDLKSIPMDDKDVYTMLSDGHTKGVFQCESAPYTNLLTGMGVQSFDDLAASNALVRPGAMNTIGKEYISRKSGKTATKYIHPIMKEFTEDTFGTIVYQEQVMLACTELGGMSMGEANKVRKIIGKKKDVTEFNVYKKKFVDGASEHIDRELAEKLWHDFEAHAGYSFNKSHAVAYSTLSYYTAWLKYYYPLEFMFSVLSNAHDKEARAEYMIETKRLGIRVRLPHVNESDIFDKIEGDGIRLGLSAIKYISGGIASSIIEARPFNSYQEVYDWTFSKGSGCNSRALASMNKVGAVTFKDNPADDKLIRESLYEYLNLPEFSFDIPARYNRYITESSEFDPKGAHIMVGMVRSIKRGKGWSRVEFLDKSGAVGIFDKEDTEVEPGKAYMLLVGNNRVVRAIRSDEFGDKSHAVIKFLNYKRIPFSDDEYFVLAFSSRKTKAQKNMATLLLANSDREIAPVVVWPSQYGDAFINLEEGQAYRMELGETRSGDVTFKRVIKTD